MGTGRFPFGALGSRCILASIPRPAVVIALALAAPVILVCDPRPGNLLPPAAPVPVLVPVFVFLTVSVAVFAVFVPVRVPV